VTGDAGVFASSAATEVISATANSGSTAAISTIDISGISDFGAQSALASIDNALAQVDEQRADLGALQNRFSYTISNLANVQENVSASRSRIQDTDFAVETAQMTKNQILQQAGTSILAQANQLPQAALSLIG
jgi:flagellin